MDWTTIRVLAKNLEELLEQHARREHVVQGKWGSVLKESWWTAVRGLTASLARALGANTEDWDHLHRDTRRFDPDAALDRNLYTEHAVALVALAKKLLADLDAARAAERAADAATTAAP